MRRTNKTFKKTAAIAAASVLAISSFGMSVMGYGEVDVSTSTFKSDTDNSQDFKTWRSQVWDAGAKADSGKIALTPGKDAAGLNFAWYSENKGTPAVKIYEYGKKSSAKIFTGTATDIDANNWQGNSYKASNKVSVENYLKENTEYRYVYTDDYTENGNVTWSDEYKYTSRSTDSFSVILTGDPQIGASGSSTDATASDDSVARDTYNWNITMQQAMITDSDAAFLLSAGDQIDTSGATSEKNLKTRESEYAGYLYSDVFRSLPIASTIGNHDMAGVDYTQHFNNPNSEANLGATAAGGDYYFSYGDVLFISLNSNNRNYSEHKTLMTEAVNSNKDAKWKVVIFHSDIYGSGQPHADTDASANRVIFAPLMDEFDIDVCLTGHDHTYSRSYQILDGNVIDYDASNSVTNPEGTLYITTGSGSGSKYYNLLNYTPYYIAERTNECLPAFSTIDFSSDALTIKTYDYTGAKYADDFTINKTSDAQDINDTIAKAEAVDTDKYTTESVDALNTALAGLKELVASIATQTDPAFEIFTTKYGTDEDPIKGYGSVVNADDKDTSMGGAANRFKRGYSTLLDKTIYLQLSNEELPIVKAETITSAQEKVNAAIEALQLKQTPSDDDNQTPSDDDNETPSNDNNEKPSDDVGAGDSRVPAAVAGIAAVAGALMLTLSRKKEDNCKEQ